MNLNISKFQPRLLLLLNIIMVIATIMALISLIIDFSGFAISQSASRNLAILNWAIVGVFITETFIRWGLRKFELSYLKSNWPDFTLIFLFLVLLIALFVYSPRSTGTKWSPLLVNFSLARAYILLTRFYIIGVPIIRAVGRTQRIVSVRLAPPQLISLSFIFVILMGTGFLLIPEATVSGNISFIDALFTVSSATCVTGLIVVDTGSYFTRFGQMVILILIQIGGLGLMTITTFFALLLGRGMSVRESVVMREALNIKLISRIPNLIVSILIVTFVSEALGALLLWIAWSGFDKFEWGSVLYYSIFHSISAFCNAGFSLFKNNLEDFRGDFITNITVTSLIIFGGLGFIAIINLIRTFIFRQGKITLHTKLVLIVTFVLIISGTFLILWIEWNNAFGDLPFSGKLMAAYFQSVTPRTAGFNTVNISQLTYASYFLIIIFMFIGASPGGTGGGIKTSTVGVIIASIRSMLKGRSTTEIFKRNIPRDIINSAFVLIIMVLIILSVFTFILLLTQKGEPMHILFELFSAFGTVGLSAGMTPNLTTLGKLIIILTMFMGRIGPVTLALALSQKREKATYEYPDESVMIG